MKKSFFFFGIITLTIGGIYASIKHKQYEYLRQEKEIEHVEVPGMATYQALMEAKEEYDENK